MTLHLSQPDLGSFSIARAGEAFEDPFQILGRLLRLALLDPGLSQGQVQTAQTVGQRLAGMLEPFGIVLDLGGKLHRLGSLGEIGIAFAKYRTTVQATEVLLRAIVLASLGQQLTGPALTNLGIDLRLG